MKTRNDILAEYVRSRYPEIEKDFDFDAYSVGVTLNVLRVTSSILNRKE